MPQLLLVATLLLPVPLHAIQVVQLLAETLVHLTVQLQLLVHLLVPLLLLLVLQLVLLQLHVLLPVPLQLHVLLLAVLQLQKLAVHQFAAASHTAKTAFLAGSKIVAEASATDAAASEAASTASMTAVLQ